MLRVPVVGRYNGGHTTSPANVRVHEWCEYLWRASPTHLQVPTTSTTSAATATTSPPSTAAAAQVPDPSATHTSQGSAQQTIVPNATAT